MCGHAARKGFSGWSAGCLCADGEAAVWAATCATLGDDVLDEARAALRELGDSSQLERVVKDAVHGELLEQALAAHRGLLGRSQNSN